MQTFLPYKDFLKSAQCLDYKRLGKQRVEAWQIYQCLTGKGSLSWKNHPAVKMWKGYEIKLLQYGIIICKEWKSRGYKDSLLIKFQLEYAKSIASLLKGKSLFDFHILIEIKPIWLGNEEFHSSHRSNLLRKNKEYYSKFCWKETDNLPYIWSVK
jgi:hypothetical protein